MLVVGLTGGIASGKSTVSTLLAKHGIPIIDADLLARQVIEPGTSGFRAVVNHFGPDRVLRSDGSLDRAAIGDIVFHDPDQRKWLNGVVHPRVRRAIVSEVFQYWIAGHWVVVLDVPLLVEAGLWRFVGEVVVVYVNERLQLSRLLSRPSNPPLTEHQAKARISSQLALSSKLAYSTQVLDNSGTTADLSAQVDRLVKLWYIQQGGDSGWWWRICWIFPPVGVTAGALCLVRSWVRSLRKGRRRGRGEVERKDPGERVEMKEMRRRTASITDAD